MPKLRTLPRNQTMVSTGRLEERFLYVQANRGPTPEPPRPIGVNFLMYDTGGLLLTRRATGQYTLSFLDLLPLFRNSPYDVRGRPWPSYAGIPPTVSSFPRTLGNGHIVFFQATIAPDSVPVDGTRKSIICSNIFYDGPPSATCYLFINVTSETGGTSTFVDESFCLRMVLNTMIGGVRS